MVVNKARSESTEFKSHIEAMSSNGPSAPLGVFKGKAKHSSSLYLVGWVWCRSALAEREGEAD